MSRNGYHAYQQLVENRLEHMLKIGKVMPDPTELRCLLIFLNPCELEVVLLMSF